MNCDVVVVNYRTPSDLKRFVGSLEQYPPSAPGELVIVDVESNEDYEREFAWGNGFHGVSIGTTDNVGYGRACNLGAAQGNGGCIALFNADIQLSAGALDACMEALDVDPSIAVVGPRQIDAAGRIRHAGILGTHANPRHRGWNERDAGQYCDVIDAVTVSGSAYFIRRSIWDELTECPLYREIAPEAVGAFLPTRHYFEETWCSYHAHAHDYRVVYFGGTTIRHDWHAASRIGGWADQQFGASRDYFRAACDHHGIVHD